MKTTKERKRKSEKLLPDERKRFNRYVDSFETKIDCAEALNISRVTLDHIIFKGKGKPETVGIIRKALEGINQIA